MKFRQMYLLLLVIIMCGCSSTPYPPDWDLLSNKHLGSCPYIEGTYKSVGESNLLICTDDIKCITVGTVILEGDLGKDIQANGITEFQIIQPNEDLLSLTLYKSGSPYKMVTYQQSKNQYKCNNGDIFFSQKAYYHLSEGAHRTKPDINLYKTQDGSLVVKEITTTTGLLLIIPIVTKQTTWYIFEKADRS